MKVPELKGSRRLGDDYGSLFQGSGRIHFPLSCNHLKRGSRGKLANSMVLCVWFTCLRQHTGLPRNPPTPRHSMPDGLSLETEFLKMCLAQGIFCYCCLPPIEQGLPIVLNRALNSAQQSGEQLTARQVEIKDRKTIEPKPSRSSLIKDGGVSFRTLTCARARKCMVTTKAPSVHISKVSQLYSSRCKPSSHT